MYFLFFLYNHPIAYVVIFLIYKRQSRTEYLLSSTFMLVSDRVVIKTQLISVTELQLSLVYALGCVYRHISGSLFFYSIFYIRILFKFYKILKFIMICLKC